MRNVIRLLLPIVWAVCCLSSTALFAVEPGTPRSSKDLWVPPAGLKFKEVPLPANAPIPPDIEARMTSLTLVDLIDLALMNSPRSRATWMAARSAKEGVESQKGYYYPGADVGLDWVKTHGSAIAGRFVFDQKTLTPNLALSYTLFDYGKRRAQVEEKRQDLIAANWDHNEVIQSVVLQVEQIYYQYLAARSLTQALEASLKEAQANLDAARARHDAGVATIADVLQAQTQVAQAQLALNTTAGSIQTARGIIAVALGISPTVPFDVVGDLPEQLPLSEVSQNVEALIAEAQVKRPDLAAARAQALKSQAHIRTVRADRWPLLETNNSFQRVYYQGQGAAANNWSAGLYLSFPLFSGFRHAHDVRQAQYDAAADAARAKDLQQQVILQTWTSYFDMKTATERTTTSQTLLDSAQQSYDVASGRYKAGVGSIIELLAAQAALEDARAQLIQAKTDWLVSLAQLAHDTGTLWLSSEGKK